jgi:hypothetical protein
MIRMVTAGATLLRDSTRPTQLPRPERVGGACPARGSDARAGLVEPGPDGPWAAEPTRVYDEVVEDVGEATDEGGGRVD